ncbi:MAG: hypothetical protein HYV29_04410 [Ignavibacteriales bacterium]|nr:hypothetical protein [Ignavibacteriales bacterium]
MKYFFFVLLTFLVAFLPDTAQSNERKFSFTYETSVLPKGAREIELWNTDRRGRSYFYRRLDQRIEYEFGVTDHLMSALYLNYSWRAKDSNDDAAGGTKSTSYSISISNEWKYKLMDRVADPFGFALYGELTAGPDKNEIEAKLLFDKQLNNILIAFNAVAEQEWSYGVVNGSTDIEEEFITEFDLGITYYITNRFSVGIEARQHSVYMSNELKHSSLFAGPSIAVSTESFWAVLTVLPQIKSFKGATTQNQLLDLGEYEKVQTRLLFSFHL